MIDQNNKNLCKLTSDLNKNDSNLLKTEKNIVDNKLILNTMSNSNVCWFIKKIKWIKLGIKKYIKKKRPQHPLELNIITSVAIFWEFYDEGVILRDEAICCLERLYYNGINLEIKGWIYAVQLNINSLGLEIDQDGEVTRLPLKYHIDRQDVVTELNAPEHINCGFNDEIFLNFKETAKFYLVLKNTTGNVKIFIGELSRTEENSVYESKT